MRDQWEEHPDGGVGLTSSIAEIVERGDKLTITTKREFTVDEQRWLRHMAGDEGYHDVKFETGAFVPSITSQEIDAFRDELGLRVLPVMGRRAAECREKHRSRYAEFKKPSLASGGKSATSLGI